MFTGIIESLGIINETKKTDFGIKLSVDVSNKIYSEVKIGDSVSINGVCLTVSNKKMKNSLYFDIVKETINKSNLSNLNISNKVNLETAIKINESLGGHIVQGHIDTTGLIINTESIDKNLILQILII